MFVTLITILTKASYWDWTLDAVSESAWPASPIFDDVYGFGGNGAYIANISNLTQTSAVNDLPGRSGGGCVTDGPFANLAVPMGPDDSVTYTPHCLRRDFSAWLATQTLNQTLVDWQLESDEFVVYDRRVQALDLTLQGITTHGGGHFGVGGMVGEVCIRDKRLFLLFHFMQRMTISRLVPNYRTLLDVQHVLLSGRPAVLDAPR